MRCGPIPDRDESQVVALGLPTGNWSSVKQATPIAKSAIAGAFLAAADDLGIKGEALMRGLNDAGIEPLPAILESPAVDEEEEEAAVFYQWLESFADVPAPLRELCDDYSPVGSDTGADVLAMYRTWRSKGGARERFLPDLLHGWEIQNRDWEKVPSSVLEEQLPDNHYQILTRDDAIIALAFAQFFVDGSVDPAVIRRALTAIERESDPAVLRFRGWVDPKHRLERLEEMRDFLTTAGAPKSRRSRAHRKGPLERLRRLWNRRER